MMSLRIRFFFLLLLPWLFIPFVLFVACDKKRNPLFFRFMMDEKTMIYNQEQDNSIEGTYLLVERKLEHNRFHLDLPLNFCVNRSTCKNWFVGWGDNIPYHDTGLENIYSIADIDVKNGVVVLGERIKGSKPLTVGQHLVFWSLGRNDFVSPSSTIIDTREFNGFNGKSLAMGGIIRHPNMDGWVMFLSECDVQRKHWYAAYSNDLVTWKAMNSGEPILSFKDCKKHIENSSCKWSTLPYLSAIKNVQNTWFFLVDGEDNIGFRTMGMIQANLVFTDAMNMKMVVTSVNSIFRKNQWNYENFSGKIAKIHNKYRIYFDNRNPNGAENVAFTTSTNLSDWTDPILIDIPHLGWTSWKKSSEPCGVFTTNNQDILLLVAGTKADQQPYWKKFFTSRREMGTPGNVHNALIGVYKSSDGGKTFLAHPNNPVIINDFLDPAQDDHMGGNLMFIKNKGVQYLFYQAKSSKGYYSICMRRWRV